MDNREQLDHKDHQDHRAREELKAELVHLVTLAQAAHKEPLARVEPPVSPVLRVQLEPLAPLETRAPREQQVQRSQAPGA